MNRRMAKLKPAVDKRVLLFLAGFTWLSVGTVMLMMAFRWLKSFHAPGSILLAGGGMVIALLVHHFGFLKIVDKNLGRILPMQESKCAFSFITWKNYLIIAVMVSMGVWLRHSAIPRSYLALLYIGIGMALLLSSIRYLRVLLVQLRNP